jgi:hypothetical protein
VRPALLLACLGICLAARPAGAGTLDALYDRIAADVRAGRPLRVVAHVALCDERILACGNPRLGDGDSLATNLYWATSGGLRGWFERRGSAWRRVASQGPDGDVLAQVTYRARVASGGALAARGVRRPVTVELTALAWRGRAIDRALDAFARDVHAAEAPHVVAFVGHNRLMDRGPYDWVAARAAGGDGPVRGFVAIACRSAPYLAAPLTSATRVPLLLTADLLFAGSHALDGVVQALARGGDLRAVRRGGAAAYATGQGKPLERVLPAFTNPSDPRWPRFGGPKS